MFDVIIPVAGTGEKLAQAVRSALSPLVNRIYVIADDSPARLAAETCAAAFPQVTALHTPGDQPSGAGAARNLGLEEALRQNRSQWLAFLDADDTYAPGYFEALADFLTRPEASGLPLVHTRLISVTGQGSSARSEERHPLRYRFSQGSRAASLTECPHMIGTSVAAAVFSLPTLAGSGVRFAEGISWSEDADFIVRLLLATGADRVGVCAEAHYLYRVQQGGSTTESAWAQPLKYTLPFERFYLPWAASSQNLPVWLQNQLLYELSIYLQVDREVFSPSLQLPPDVLKRCAHYVKQVLGHIDSSTLEGFALVPLGLDRRQMFLAHTRGSADLPYSPLTSRQVFAYTRRPWRTISKYTYFYRAEPLAGREVPAELFRLQGGEVQPVAAKWVSHRLFGVEMVRERILWFPKPPIFSLAGHTHPGGCTLCRASPGTGQGGRAGRASLPRPG